jgi:hypothetical protein
MPFDVIVETPKTKYLFVCVVEIIVKNPLGETHKLVYSQNPHKYGPKWVLWSNLIFLFFVNFVYNDFKKNYNQMLKTLFPCATLDFNSNVYSKT